ncbi:UDP-N-acetylmuramate--L-alanine ligase [bacterium (Candidatus Gribaldobacteria) CG08_land_8_20_14_0_20_39_15]|uniref:UDP-N-acetylmuramate--L-alanine ligase n=1 Tax=bacterium (Candidatus Gribaldobacteria) CG08_land_8_20_14_0_20_39_15 TaxID=2014273 RepID=A0A2M6XTZ1_9BACT|nr:MAG: UDP-N-acetylmuramate--L-alanine ligase [bacterium (Candidatus Gribaldobacteria) CG08_land_8_20_14_0_20_39_15]
MKIHFIGIGGIAISGIANIYKQKGHKVQGSDVESSEITEELKKQGIKVFIGHKKENLRYQERHARVRRVHGSGRLLPNLVVYSEAVPQNNSELKEARRLKIECLSGAQVLAALSKDYFTIAVSGMHGKSTTASMIAQILIKAGFDPSFIIGTKPGWRLGKSKYLIIEADDYQAKFLHYYPDILVLTNIEEEHMDFFKNFQHIIKVFRQYTKQVKDYIVANKDNENVLKILNPKSEILNLKWFGKRTILSQAEGQIQNSKLQKIKKRPEIKFYSLKDKEASKVSKILRVPGKHNVSNALAALQTARLLKINDKVSFKALSEYKGVWRRFEISKFEICNLKFEIVSDYAHHPTEIEATLQAATEKFKNKKIWLVFQPHQYQRTFYLFSRFVKTFALAQKKFNVANLIITDIYTVEGRESQTIKNKVNSQKLVEAINKSWAIYLPQNQVLDYLAANLKGGEVIIIMGAGNVYKLAERFSTGLN